MATGKNIELIKKLMALAERGVGGEKDRGIRHWLKPTGAVSEETK